MIYITGDTHAHFHDFTSRIEHAGIGNSDTAIVCGDFGFTLGRDYDEMHLNAMELLPYTMTVIMRTLINCTNTPLWISAEAKLIRFVKIFFI